MAKYQLIYFQVRGRAEAIRYLFNDNGLDYEEVDCGPNWQTEWKSQMAFGQTPCLKDKDLTLVQSNAILRHLARKHGLYGSSEAEAAYIDMIVDGVEDVRGKYAKLIYTNYNAGKEDYVKELPAQLLPFEKLISKLGDAKAGFSVGSKKSLSDYALFDLLDIHLTLSPSCLDEMPELTQFYKVVLSRPGITAYRQTDGFKGRKINGNDNQ